MVDPAAATARAPLPSLSATVELLKPITWFAPMWAFACGVVSTGTPLADRWLYIAGGIVLAGPLVCGTSQAVNDWYDRVVDAINEPDRVIPSGRMPGRWALYIAVANTGLSLIVAALLGAWVLAAAVVGLSLAWAYSAPPFRLKRSGWLGPGAVGLCYESLPWFTAAAAAVGFYPGHSIAVVALLYGIGAHGIMTLNDFKAVDGDRRMGLASLPVTLGVRNAARLACAVMAAAQIAIIALLLVWDRPVFAAIVAASLAAQGLCMMRLLRDPARLAPWYNATGTTLYVLGMMATAVALAGLDTGASSLMLETGGG